MAVTSRMRLALCVTASVVTASVVAVAAPASGAAAVAPPAPAARPGAAVPLPRQPGTGGGPGARIDPLPVVSHAHAVPAAGSPWHALAHRPPFNPGAMLLLTDGTVLVQSQGPKNHGSAVWWRLTPNKYGNYVKGTWSRAGSLPAGYAPLYFASAVLPDGRVIIMGGEYNFGRIAYTSLGAIYDPGTGAWTPVRAPSGRAWRGIGDAPSTVLANGTFMLGSSGMFGARAQALFNARRLSWRRTGSGKADGNQEEGWSLLPDGDVLTVDTSRAGKTEIYSPSSGRWRNAGNTPVRLVDSHGEVGPQVLRPNGTVFAAGATGSTAIYHTGTHRWARGPRFPLLRGKRLDVADGPAAVLPNGSVLVAASPGEYKPPTRVFDFNGTKLAPVPAPPGAASFASNDAYMLVLPTGQVLFNSRVGRLDVYDPAGSPRKAWRPAITRVASTLFIGSSYKVSGTQLNGLTQASAYGDDYQSATNYPLVRLTSRKSGAVFYARTSGMTRMTVAAHARSSAYFTIPVTAALGQYTLVVVANGIASAPVDVTVVNGG